MDRFFDTRARIGEADRAIHDAMRALEDEYDAIRTDIDVLAGKRINHAAGRAAGDWLHEAECANLRPEAARDRNRAHNGNAHGAVRHDALCAVPAGRMMTAAETLRNLDELARSLAETLEENPQAIETGAVMLETLYSAARIIKEYTGKKPKRMN